jgi:dipicolinate synthase subunit A
MIYSYENSLRADTCTEYLRGVDGVEKFDSIILLPIPSTKDKKTIMNTKVVINELTDQIYGKTLISSYGLDNTTVRVLTDAGATLIELSEDEEFLLENAELTAVATLGILLTSTKISTRDLRVGIVGYGRIGKRLVNHFLYLGASVRVFTSRADTRLDLCAYGVASVRSCADADLSNLDLLINTAPAVIFSPSSIPKGLRIIDLASGENFPGVDAVERYPSVPARMFPISAGRTWGRALERRIVNIH